MDLIRWKSNCNHVSEETVNNFEETFQLISNATVTYQSNGFVNKIINKLLMSLYENGFLFKISSLQLLKKNTFVILLGTEFKKCLSKFFLNKKNIVYFFDAWPNKHAQIKLFIKTFNIETVFFSSKQVTDLFNAQLLSVHAFWIPEGVNIEHFKFNDYDNKDIDVLQFGRKYDFYHNEITGKLTENGFFYLFEKKKGEIVFANQECFLNGLARTKISICFPCNLTHPERSGDISTMTVRYLESMASKCLIVGVMPEDMKDLFDYEPIIEVDFNNPADQLLSILRDYHTYIPLIEKNYEIVAQCHTWKNRSEKIMRIITDESI